MLIINTVWRCLQFKFSIKERSMIWRFPTTMATYSANQGFKRLSGFGNKKKDKIFILTTSFMFS